MRFRGLDLNLLAALAVLLEERSVSVAAKRLNLSQPAVSAALARLRLYFGDELLVLDGKRMFPTALAESLAEPVNGVLEKLGTMLDGAAGFKPEASRRQFRIAASDYVTMVLVRPLIALLADAAPGIRIVVELPGDRTSARLDEGRIDLAIMPADFASPRQPAEPAFDDSYVVVGWKENSLFSQPLTEADFFAADHIGVQLGSDAPGAFADRQLDRLGKARRMTTVVPTFSAVPWMVVGSNQVGMMHGRLASLMSAHLPIAVQPLPFDFPKIQEIMQYHRSRRDDPGLSWLRGRLAACAGETAVSIR